MFLDQVRKGNRSAGAYLPTLALIIVIFLAGQLLASFVIIGVAAAKGNMDVEAMSTLDFERLGISPNLGFLILMLSYLVAFFGLLFARVFHKRPFLTFVTSRRKLDFKRIGFGMLVWGLILAGSTLADYFMDPENYIVTFDPKSFIWLFAIALILFPFQISFEEIFFRGYLYQLTGNLFKYPIIAWILTSVLFGLMHSANPEVQEYGFWVIDRKSTRLNSSHTATSRMPSSA